MTSLERVGADLAQVIEAVDPATGQWLAQWWPLVKSSVLAIRAEENPPTIRALHTLNLTVQAVCRDGGGSPRARAEVAIGLIRDRLAEAYGLELA